MAGPHYQPSRPSRRGGPRATPCLNPLHVLAGGFFVVYLCFLVSWRFGDVSNLEGAAPIESLSTLRQVRTPLVHVESENTLDVENAAQRQEEAQNMHERVRPLPIHLVFPTTAPLTAAPVATRLDVAGTEKPNELPKGVVNEELAERGLGMPVQTVEEPILMQEQVEITEVVAAVEPVVVFATEQVDLEAVPPNHVAPDTSLVSSIARHEEIYGYEATTKFLENYQYNPDESLFLFFVCSDEQFEESDWSEECVEGKKHVYDVFATSPERNRLVTVFAGSETYWKHQNDFHNHPDLRVKGVPCIMQWEGRNGRTEGMLVQRSLYDEPFLRYLFMNTDQAEVLFDSEDVKTKHMITVKGYDGYVDAMAKYEQETNPVPTFVMMVSGRFQDNNRLWCPYCRYSELPVAYAFYSYAPKNARMIRVEVTDSYLEWKKGNEFTRDENLHLKIVPLMFHIEPIPAASASGIKSIKFTPHMVPYDELASLRELFTSFA